MNRLWVRFSLAFSAVALVGVLMIGAISVLITDPGVLEYFVKQDLQAPGGLVDQLADYYREHQSWDGVDILFTPEQSFPSNPGGPFELMLTDANGQIILAPDAVRFRMPLPPPRPGTNVLPIMVDGQVQGYLSILRPPGQGPPNQTQFLLDELSRLLLLIALAGGSVGALFGILMSRTLTAPLRRLAEAARAIGARDLNRRVEMRGSREIVEVARAFNDMASALEQNESLRRNLVADVAHELRTPLTVLQGNLRAILDDVYSLDKTEIARLYDQTRLLSRLVNDLHELAQAEARQLPLNVQNMDLARLVTDVAAAFGPIAEAEGLTLNVNVSPGVPTIPGDPSRITQILHNLLLNALRHTPDGGSISIRVEYDAALVQVAVQDTGQGIPAEHLPHVFERFYRADRARSRSSGGSGLGLAIVRAITEAHGGHVAAASDGIPGHGAAFTVYLPREPRPDA